MSERSQAFAETARALAVAHMCGKVLEGEGPGVQGAALAELMSIFLLGHKIPGDLEAQGELRTEILEEWCKTVRQLVAIHDSEP
jgi:hypothetical protein